MCGEGGGKKWRCGVKRRRNCGYRFAVDRAHRTKARACAGPRESSYIRRHGRPAVAFSRGQRLGDPGMRGGRKGRDERGRGGGHKFDSRE
mgnify:CR=1 FL=1